ncbi:MAG: hypothetical protein Q8887_02735 [Candidatus Phytoplasma australasiaticum]|nr:hypothetical protein [Candidatus Phytoplasma australasiaticum]
MPNVDDLRELLLREGHDSSYSILPNLMKMDRDYRKIPWYGWWDGFDYTEYGYESFEEGKVDEGKVEDSSKWAKVIF